MDTTAPIHSQVSNSLRGPLPLSLSFEGGDERFTVPDPDELPKDLALSPSKDYLLRFLRENMKCSELNHTTNERSMEMDNDPEMGTSVVTQSGRDVLVGSSIAERHPLYQQPQGPTYKIPTPFSPHSVKRLLQRVSKAVEIGPINKTRSYRFHTRITKSQKSPTKRRKQRLQRALRGDNPFLIWNTEMQCCKRFQCFASFCPHYLYGEYKKVNAMNKLQAKRYLISLYDVNDGLWYVRGKKVCARFLHKAFGFSTDLQCQVKGRPRARAAPTPRALPRVVQRTTKRWIISNFILCLAQRFAEAMPHKEEFALPLFTKTMLWKEFEAYWEERREESLSAPSKCYFFKVWKTYAAMVKVQKRHCFTVCSRCEMLRAEMAKHLRDEETLNVLIEQYANHIRFIESERDMYEKGQSLAEENPGKYCSIILDGVDQKNHGLPHFPRNTKFDVGHKLKVKVVGCLEHVLRGGEKLSLYAMTEEYATGANHVIEVAYRVLQRKKDIHGKLPPILFVQVDNCMRENKNRYFMAYFQLFVHLGVFKKVQVSFLPIGHTHADIDQSFSSISAHLNINEAITFADMISELSKCYAGRAQAFELDKMINFSELSVSSGCLTDVTNFSEYRFFLFTCKNAENIGRIGTATCDVRVQGADEWIPFLTSGAEGFLKFVPNFSNTPKTKTKELPNYDEVSKCFDSAEGRVKDDGKMESLRALRDKVFEVREESFHWNVESIFEMHGDYAGNNEVTVDDFTSSHVDDQMRLSYGYEADDFVAVETREDANTRFWIARVKEVSEVDSQGRAKMLRVRWYVPRGGDPWNAKYVPAWKLLNGETTVYEDTVDVACVILRFNNFTTAGKLRVSDKKAIKQMFDGN